ncbi:hypothetical protein AAFF_G00362100 [Aldrovandia affinis]|uniref:CCHC-type domain-containing protein n=1 Tax=Aldrovandia affinis TaxID=143900 RepID=A0AAD7WMV8_9TELE|nr:hypothetical protein AAFF_G00362100 [Aldrovandia affinis]
MPPSVQSELAWDQFIRALSPVELRNQTQLAHPQTLLAALELALKREIVWTGAAMDAQRDSTPTVRAVVGSCPEQEKPAWVAEVTELLRAVSLQMARNTRPGARLCWGCGQPGHLVRNCPSSPRAQGNGPGSA